MSRPDHAPDVDGNALVVAVRDRLDGHSDQLFKVHVAEIPVLHVADVFHDFVVQLPPRSGKGTLDR